MQLRTAFPRSAAVVEVSHRPSLVEANPSASLPVRPHLAVDFFRPERAVVPRLDNLHPLGGRPRRQPSKPLTRSGSPRGYSWAGGSCL